MPFNRLSCFLLMVTCFFLVGNMVLPPELLKGMVRIRAGEFRMGGATPGRDPEDNEKPRHMVYADAFYMDKYEVTNAQYKKFVDANPQWGKKQD